MKAVIRLRLRPWSDYGREPRPTSAVVGLGSARRAGRFDGTVDRINIAALMSAVERGDRGGAGLIPRRRAAARGARLTDLVLCVLVDLAGAFGDAGAVTSTMSKRTRSGCCATRAEARRRGTFRLRDDPTALSRRRRWQRRRREEDEIVVLRDAGGGAAAWNEAGTAVVGGPLLRLPGRRLRPRLPPRWPRPAEGLRRRRTWPPSSRPPTGLDPRRRRRPRSPRLAAWSGLRLSRERRAGGLPLPLRRLRRRPSRRGLGEAAMAAESVIGFVGVVS